MKDVFERISNPENNTVKTCVKALLKAYNGNAENAWKAVCFSSAMIVADSKALKISPPEGLSEKELAVLFTAKLADIKWLALISNALKVLMRQQEGAEPTNDFSDLL